MEGDGRGTAWRYLGAKIKEQRAGVTGGFSGLGWQASAVLAPLMVTPRAPSGPSSRRSDA